MSKYAKFRAAAAAAVLPNQPPSTGSEKPEPVVAPTASPPPPQPSNTTAEPTGVILAPAPKVAADDFHAFDDVSGLMPGLYVGDDLPAAILPPEAAPALGNVPPELKTVESLGLKGSIVKALMREGITSLSDLLALGEDHNWQSITGIGAKAVDEVKAAIRANQPAVTPEQEQEQEQSLADILPPLIAFAGGNIDHRLLSDSKGWGVSKVFPSSAPNMIATLRQATCMGPSLVVFEEMPKEVREYIDVTGGLVIDLKEATVEAVEARVEPLPPLIAITDSGSHHGQIVKASKGWNVIQGDRVFFMTSTNEAAMIATLKLAMNGTPSILVFKDIPERVKEFIERAGGLVMDVTNEVPF